MKPLKLKELNWKMIFVFILVFVVVNQILTHWEYIETSIMEVFK